MIDSIAGWPGGASALVTLILTGLSFIAFGLAAWFGVRAGSDGRPSPAALLHSGWSMSTRQILATWTKADPDVVRWVRRSFWCDLVASLALGAALLIAAATVGEDEGIAAIRHLRDPAAWAAIVGAVAALVVDGSLLHVLRLYRRTRAVGWLAVSLAMTMVLIRLGATALAIAYVFVAAAAT